MRGRLLAVFTAAAMVFGMMPQSAIASPEKEVSGNKAEISDVEEAVVDSDVLKTGEDETVPENSYAASEDTSVYSHTYTQNANLMDKDKLPGVYTVTAKKGESIGADNATIGIPSIAKQNLQSAPTTESPAIIQGAAVPFEERVATGSRIEFRKKTEEPICAPYSRFRYKIIEEADANGNGTHQKISGFDGTYVIVRVDVSDIIKEALKDTSKESYLHVKVSENKAMLTAVGMEETKEGDKVTSVTFTDNTGTRTACYSLANDAAALKDKDGISLDKPYIDLIMMSSGTLVAGADKGTAGAKQADFPVSFYVDDKNDYDPSIGWDPDSSQVINSDTREVITDRTDSKGTVIKTAQAMLLDKYYNEDKAKEAGLKDTDITSYTVKDDDLELEVMVDETQDDSSTERQYWSLRRAMDYQRYNRHTIRLMCEVPVLEGLVVEDTEGSKDRAVVLDVNSFDIQIANHAATNSAALTVKGATLTLKDDSNTTGAELAVGNNASMVITDNGKLVIDRTCQVEVEYDAASTAAGAEPQPDATKLTHGLITVNNGGEIENNGIMTVEGKEGKAAGVDAATIVRNYQDACLTIGEGGTLTNNGCVLVNGRLFNLGTIVNNGRYADVITSNDPDKGNFTYHKGMQLSWKDDVTQGQTNGGMLFNGMDEDRKIYKSAHYENNGDLVMIPGYIYNYAKMTNNGELFLTSVDEVMRPITPTQDAPAVTEERIKLGYPENSYFYNYEDAELINTGKVRTADFEITSNGRTGDMKSEVNPYLKELEIIDWGGKITNSGSGVIALDNITTCGKLLSLDNAALKGTFSTGSGQQEVVTRVTLASLRGLSGSYTDSSSVKSGEVYNGTKTLAGGANTWNFAKIKSLTVSPASMAVGSGDTVDWTLKAEPETAGEEIRYHVVYTGDNLKDEDLFLEAGKDFLKKSPAAPIMKGNLVYSFIAQYAGGASASAVLKVNDETASKVGVSRPTAMQDLVYNGTDQTLLTVGYATEGTVKYSVNNGEFSAARPKAKNAGTYKVAYKVVKSDDDSVVLDEGGTIEVTIAKRPLYIAADDTGSKKGEAIKELTYTALGIVEADRESLGIKLSTEAKSDSAVGSYPITLNWNPNENYEYKGRISNGKYYITDKYINMTVSSNLTGYRNMNEGLGGAVKYKRDETKATETLCKVYYSDKKELNSTNYKTDGVTALTYAAVGTDKTVYYYVEEAGISGSQRIVITKGEQKEPGLKSQGGVLEPTGEGPAINGFKPREMEYRRSDSETYTKAVHEIEFVAAGTYYVRSIGTERYYPSPDTEVVVPDQGKEPLTVKFDANGGTIGTETEKTVSVIYGDQVAKPEPDPVRSGYSFKGWLYEDEPYDFTSVLTMGITLKADWDTVKYAVSFDTNDGIGSVKTQKVESGQKAEKPADPVRAGYSFGGWKKDGAAYDFNSSVTGDITLTADWIPIKYRLVFNANGGSGSMEDQELSYDTASALKKNVFTRPDYDFANWNDRADGSGKTYADEQSINNLTTENGKVFTLYAQWKKKLTSGDITVTVEGSDDIRYTGKEIRPNVIVKDGDTDITRFCRLTYSDNVKVGTARVTVAIQGINSGYSEKETREATFVIQKKVYDDSFGELNRRYLASDEVTEILDLTKYLSRLPGDRGDTKLSVSVEGSVSYTEAPDAGMESEKLLLRYRTKKSDKAQTGKINVIVSMLNYQDSKIVVNVFQDESAIYMKNGKNYEVFDNDVITGKKFTLALMKSPSEPVRSGVTFSSSDPAVAAVSKSGSVSIKNKEGDATITAEAGSIKASCTLHVTQAAKKVELNYKSYKMGTGESIKLTARITPSEAGQGVAWSVNKTDPADITVNDDGTVTVKASKKGSIKLTAEAMDGSKKKASCSISIGDPVTGFTVSGKGNKNMVQAGSKLTMQAKFEGKPKNKDVVWKVTKLDGTDASAIADITAKGVLAGKSEGVVRVTATSVSNPEKSASADITVYVPVKKVALSPAKGEVSIASKSEMELGAIVTAKTAGLKATGERLGAEPSVEYTVDRKYDGKLIIQKKGNAAIIKAADGAQPAKNIPVKVTVKAYNGYTKTLTCRITVK